MYSNSHAILAKLRLFKTLFGEDHKGDKNNEVGNLML